MSNQANTSDSIHFVAHARHYKAQRSITMLYTVRDETNNAENVWKKTNIIIHSVHLNTHIRCTVCRPGCRKEGRKEGTCLFDINIKHNTEIFIGKIISGDSH